MVTSRSLGEELLVGGQLLRVRERDAVYALKRVVCRVSKEIRCGVLSVALVGTAKGVPANLCDH